MDLVVEMCDPRIRETEIKSLFARNGQSGFDAVFERAYRSRAEQGLRSWIGLSGDQAVMHISVTPMPFAGLGQTLVGGVLGDLMVDESHRDFWAPVRLLRTMVSDLKQAGQIDFLLTTTIADAEPVFKAGGFKPFGKLRRFVLPLSRPYLGVARVKGRVASFTAAPAGILPAFGNLSPRDGTHWRVQTDAEYYDTRIPRGEFADGTWIGVGAEGGASPAWALVSRSGKRAEMGLADMFWNEEGIGVGEVVHAAAQWARRQRFRKLTLTTLQESQVAQQLNRAGCLARDVRSDLLVQQLGPRRPPSVENWFLPGFALSTW
jgi:hypothetical protein